jgi:heme exporter protein D
MGGYEAFVAAAFVKKHVPLVIVTEKNKGELQ